MTRAVTTIVNVHMLIKQEICQRRSAKRKKLCGCLAHPICSFPLASNEHPKYAFRVKNLVLRTCSSMQRSPLSLRNFLRSLRSSYFYYRRFQARHAQVLSLSSLTDKILPTAEISLSTKPHEQHGHLVFMRSALASFYQRQAVRAQKELGEVDGGGLEGGISDGMDQSFVLFHGPFF